MKKIGKIQKSQAFTAPQPKGKSLVVLHYNQVCKNHGQHPRCEGRFKRHNGQDAEYCPTCIHLQRLALKRAKSIQTI